MAALEEYTYFSSSAKGWNEWQDRERKRAICTSPARDTYRSAKHILHQTGTSNQYLPHDCLIWNQAPSTARVELMLVGSCVCWSEGCQEMLFVFYFHIGEAMDNFLKARWGERRAAHQETWRAAGSTIWNTVQTKRPLLHVPSEIFISRYHYYMVP